MFRCWALTEMPYPYVPTEDVRREVRTTIPNEVFDPDTGYDLYKKYFDIFEAADELGLDIMVNEHHSTATCIDSVAPLSLAILARTTSRARLLILGNPIANRPDPVRVAEEMAFADVVSGGRIEVGFVRGAPMELSPTNSNPVDMKRRFWEAADLIVKAWTTHDGPFSWEGEFFHHREVNIWPRPYQQPHPPVWVTTLNPSSSRELAERDVTLATMINGKSVCGPMFSTYRDTYRALGRGLPDPAKLAYCGFVYVGDTDEEALEEGKKLQWFVQQVLRTPDGFQDLPGYVDPAVRALAMKGMARGLSFTDALTQGGTSPKDYGFGPLEPWIDEGLFFVGDADSVFEQLRDFYRAVGGFGNFLMMVQASTMSYDHARRSMERFVNDVLPRFRAEVHDPFVASGAQAPAELG